MTDKFGYGEIGLDIYISKEAAFNSILKLVPKVDDDGYCWVIRGDAAKAIDSIPAADVQPVRHGRWMYETETEMFQCSVCGGMAVRNEYPFCHWCGAKMDGGGE